MRLSSLNPALLRVVFNAVGVRVAVGYGVGWVFVLSFTHCNPKNLADSGPRIPSALVPVYPRCCCTFLTLAMVRLLYRFVILVRVGRNFNIFKRFCKCLTDFDRTPGIAEDARNVGVFRLMVVLLCVVRFALVMVPMLSSVTVASKLILVISRRILVTVVRWLRMVVVCWQMGEKTHFWFCCVYFI